MGEKTEGGLTEAELARLANIVANDCLMELHARQGYRQLWGEIAPDKQDEIRNRFRFYAQRQIYDAAEKARRQAAERAPNLGKVASTDIIAYLAEHPTLGRAWSRLSQEQSREVREAIEALIDRRDAEPVFEREVPQEPDQTLARAIQVGDGFDVKVNSSKIEHSPDGEIPYEERSEGWCGLVITDNNDGHVFVSLSEEATPRHYPDPVTGSLETEYTRRWVLVVRGPATSTVEVLPGSGEEK